jgi:hypothetical protein
LGGAAPGGDDAGGEQGPLAIAAAFERQQLVLFGDRAVGAGQPSRFPALCREARHADGVAIARATAGCFVERAIRGERVAEQCEVAHGRCIPLTLLHGRRDRASRAGACSAR